MRSISDIGKRGRGRPKTEGSPTLVRLPPELAKLIDSWRNKQPDSPGRPEAIRRLVEQALSRPKLAPTVARRTRTPQTREA
jgi:hypothetical protein